MSKSEMKRKAAVVGFIGRAYAVRADIRADDGDVFRFTWLVVAARQTEAAAKVNERLSSTMRSRLIVIQAVEWSEGLPSADVIYCGVERVPGSRVAEIRK